MLANNDIHKEVEYIETTRKELTSKYEKASLKGIVMVIKLLHNIRTNMVSVMRHNNISLVESEKRNTATDTAKKEVSKK